MKDRFRQGDLLTRDEREGDRFLLFLGGRRQGEIAYVAADLRKLADRVEDYLTPRVGRLTLPYLRERPIIDVGYGFVLSSPLESDERQILRLLDDAEGLRGSAQGAPRAGPARAADRDHLQPSDLDRVPADRGDGDAAGHGLGGSLPGTARLGARAADGPLRTGRPPRPHRGARALLPTPGVRGLGGVRRARAALREHRPRHHPRHELPRPRRARLPRSAALAPPRDPGDHRAPGHRQPQPVPGSHALLHRPGLLLRDRRPRCRLFRPGDGGRPPAPTT